MEKYGKNGIDFGMEKHSNDSREIKRIEKYQHIEPKSANEYFSGGGMVVFT